MDEVKIIGLLTNGGSFAVLVFLVVWVVRFVPKRMERFDKIREVEADARKEAANTLQKAVVEQERAQTERINRLIAGHAKAISDLSTAFDDKLTKIMASYKEQTQYERESCERRHGEILEELRSINREAIESRSKQMELLREIAHGFRDMMQTRANERSLQKMKGKREDTEQGQVR